MQRNWFLDLVLVASLAVAAGACKKDDKSAKPAGEGAAKAVEGGKKESPAPAPLTAEQKVQRVKDCWAAFDAGDDAKLTGCYADNATSEYLGAMPPRSATGSKAIVAMHAENRVAFPDLKHEIVLIMVSGNEMLVVVGSSGTNTGPLMGLPATNKKMGVLSPQYLVLNDQGLVEREEFVVDSGVMIAQLGLVPEQTVPVYETGSMGEARVVIAADDDKEKASLEMVRKHHAMVNERKLDDAMELVADEVVIRSTLGRPEKMDRKAVRKRMDEILAAVPDMHVELAWSFAAGDLVASRLDARGTHTGPLEAGGKKLKPTGSTLETSEISVDRIEDGRFVEGWNFLDQLRTAVMLGVVPDPTQASPQKDGDKAAGAEKKSAN